MNVYILFGQRVCDYTGQYAPEALEIMDEFAYDENGVWLHEKLEAAEKTKEFTALRIIHIGVGDMEKLRELVVGIPSIKGAVKGAVKGTCSPEGMTEKTSEHVVLDALNSKDLTHLRAIAKQRNGHNDYMQGWKTNETSRNKLKQLKLVTVKSFPAAGMGDVATTVCEVTIEGRAVLQRAAR